MSPSFSVVRRIQCTTIASVAFLAAIAGMVSFRHMRELCLRHGEDQLAAVLIPLAVDGTIVVASMSILLASRYGARGGALAWAMLVTGSLASLGANVAVAEPTVVGRIIAAWPSAALIGSYELLMAQIRRLSTYVVDDGHSVDEDAVDGMCSVSPSADDEPRQSAGPSHVSGRLAGDLQRMAWHWATANRRSDGALPTGKEIAENFSRSPRWGRWIKRAGLAGELE
ncbi:hypothetical protein DP939_42185 [Spongiactinospora rosea]|uniref:DUF2637 domain-containing protein n=2 Tax=Spongiactinospora rosea TaxID=2248750 RepID=A0A366LLK9_9ACTN|nr:hypothetical protein DP939_42185 [Spongiactinospora rosea]